MKQSRKLTIHFRRIPGGIELLTSQPIGLSILLVGNQVRKIILNDNDSSAPTTLFAGTRFIVGDKGIARIWGKAIPIKAQF